MCHATALKSRILIKEPTHRLAIINTLLSGREAHEFELSARVNK
jgi:hypothetical protein